MNHNSKRSSGLRTCGCIFFNLLTNLINLSDIKMKFSSEIVREGQSVNLTCNTCELSPNTTYSFYWNGQHLKTLQNQNQLVLKAVRSHQEGSYSCSAKTGENKISSDPKFLNVISTSENQLQAAAAVGAGAAALVMIPVMIFIWFRWATWRSVTFSLLSEMGYSWTYIHSFH